jgi:hypothetical protein
LRRCVGLSADGIAERIHAVVTKAQRDDVAILALAARAAG